MFKIKLTCITCNKVGSFLTKKEDEFSIKGIVVLTCKGICNGKTSHRIDNIEYVYSENQ